MWKGRAPAERVVGGERVLVEDVDAQLLAEKIGEHAGEGELLCAAGG